jgi:hypothetical protein
MSKEKQQGRRFNKNGQIAIEKKSRLHRLSISNLRSAQNLGKWLKLWAIVRNIRVMKIWQEGMVSIRA